VLGAGGWEVLCECAQVRLPPLRYYAWFVYITNMHTVRFSHALGAGGWEVLCECAQVKKAPYGIAR